jgi:hypothetical protein
MILRIRSLTGALLAFLVVPILLGQTPSQPANSPTATAATAAPTTTASASPTTQKPVDKSPVQSGIDRPAIVIPADTDEVTTTILLRGLDAKPENGDLEAGLLTSTQQPSLLIRPSVVVVGAPIAQGKDFLTTIKVNDLAAFGDTTAPLLYKGKQVEILRFSKPGLLAKPPVGDSFIIREQGFQWLKELLRGPQPPAILLVLENPSTSPYASVRGRLRFDNHDVCLFTAEKFPTTPKPGTGDSSCNTSDSWTEFNIPQYAQVSLRADPSWSWFFDPATNYARSAKRKGWLTLRFKGTNAAQIQEQDISMEVQFEPSGLSLFGSLFWVAVWLALGASLSLFLRVTVPNMRRKSQLKDQLNEAGKDISTISAEVDSNLRVLLRVERRTLDELRVAVWPFGPGYADYATRVEQGLPVLNRRIAAVIKLDAALIRKKALSDQNVAPTKLEQIEEMLSAASETLKQDLLSDEDWVFVNQRLENAQKLLREPSQTEKEAFEAMLANRWKAIKAHFGFDNDGNLIVPTSLAGMKSCFPDRSLLPDRDDQKFPEWLDSIGIERADLQLSALNLVWEFQFLLPRADSPSASTPPTTPSSAPPASAPPANPPTSDPSGAGTPPPANTPPPNASPSTATPPNAPPPNDLPSKWKTAMERLNGLLSTPAVGNLREAKRELRQLAEGVSEDDLRNALKAGAATIVMDPSIARPDRRMRFSVEFRRPKLNSVAARQLITCHWIFDDSFGNKLPWYKRHKTDQPEHQSQDTEIQETGPDLKLPENGWFVHHYFEKSAYQSVVTVSFHDSQGQPIVLEKDQAWAELTVRPRPDTRGNENWQRFLLEVTQVGAALLVPLATLASNTVSGGNASHWWEIAALGFGSDTIKNIIVGKDSTPAAK